MEVSGGNRKSNKNSGLFMLSCMAAACILSLAAEGKSMAATGQVDPELERVLLQGKWEAVDTKCGPSDEKLAEAPLLRAIKGHACLALNRNNEALVLLLSIGNEKEKLAWKAYTQSLSQRSNGNAIALYLQGDGLARAGDLDGAIDAYGKVLSARPGFQLALIGRGTALAAKEQWNAARKDFEEATKKQKDQPPLAEAYASMGALQILKKAPEGARQSYEKSLTISKDYVLALNGLACANYGLADWQSANKYFAEAARSLPLTLFVGNLRALDMAAENLQLPGEENSPFFRFTDFYDWDNLREETLKPDDVFRSFLGREPPAELDLSLITEMNAALENLQFYGAAKGKIKMEGASRDLEALIEETALLRKETAAIPGQQQIEKIRRLNRMILEHAYPLLIAKHTQRDPGTQLTLTHGMVNIVNQQDYMRSLSPARLAQGQWTKDTFGRTLQNILISTGNPWLVGAGRLFGSHLDQSDRNGAMIYQEKTGTSINTVRYGGVTTEMRNAFIDSGKWPVVTWFGMVHSTSFEPR